jgi:DNA topoisomerase-1
MAAKKAGERNKQGKAARGGKRAPARAKAPAKPAKGSGKAARPRRATPAPRPAATPRARGKGGPGGTGTGRQLVIVESPAKARTINKYLGSEFVVRASIGHVRDLPARAAKGERQPVPGVDLENGFAPTYVILPGKSKTLAELKREARRASEVWFATDLDREGEAIAWHLAEELGIDPSAAKRVVFNAITKAELQRAFAHPRPIDRDKFNAQQARRILDRIVGYQASPLLWKKVARNLSAGRVQSVAMRLVVDREREIAAFVPDESWRVVVRLVDADADAPGVGRAWSELLARVDARGRGPLVKDQNAWMAEQGAIRAELVEVGGRKLDLGCRADAPADLSGPVAEVATACGMIDVEVVTRVDPAGKGPARHVRTVTGQVDPAARYRVEAIETRRNSTRPPPPFITSSLQIAAANQLGFSAQRTMRLAQDLYEGVELAGEGQVALITYMRTDSTHLSGEALSAVRGFIDDQYGREYLPGKPNVFSSSNKDAQEAHEAIRPNDVLRHPDVVREQLRGPRAEDQWKLYNLIWRRLVSCQMTPAQWDATAVTMRRRDRPTGAVLRATGRTLAFDGFYRVAGVPTASDEQTLPAVAEGRTLSPFAVAPEQKFSSPPPRYSEASLVKTLEAEGIGRPSTYASIIQVIQDRKYVEQRERRFYATDLGEVVTDKLVEAFPEIMDVGYTRQLEADLDQVEEAKVDWVAMLDAFYAKFSASLERAHEDLQHAKAEIQPAPYECPQCGARTCYRFGRNGRFLSCTRYPDCDYAAPIDRQGQPLLPERVDIECPLDGSDMELRNGRFGPFVASVAYPETDYVINLDKRGNIKFPAIPPVITALPCPKCGSPLGLRRGKRGPWLGCSAFPRCRGRLPWTSLDEADKTRLERELTAHERKNPRPVIRRKSDQQPIAEGTPVRDLLVAGGVASLRIHPEVRPASAPG